MIQKEENRAVEHSVFNRELRTAETIAFHQERASFWLRCAESARNAISRSQRNAYALEHSNKAKLLEFELNDNQ